MWQAFRTAAGMHSHPDFRLAHSRVLARREAHVAGEDELAAHAPDAASNLGDAGQIELGKGELRIGALEYDDTQARAGVHSSKQILEAFADGGVYNVERRIIEQNPPI